MIAKIKMIKMYICLFEISNTVWSLNLTKRGKNFLREKRGQILTERACAQDISSETVISGLIGIKITGYVAFLEWLPIFWVK